MDINKQEIFIIGVLFAVALAGALYSSDGDLLIKSEQAALTQTKVGLAQAVYTAEQYVNGKASKAEIKDDSGTLVYDVEVIHGNTAKDVKVDIKTGRVLGAPADKVFLP